MSKEVHLSLILETFGEQQHHAIQNWAEFKDRPGALSNLYDGDLRGHEQAMIGLALKVAVLERPAMLRSIDAGIADTALDLANDSIRFALDSKPRD